MPGAEPHEEVLVSVAITNYNGGDLLLEVIRACRGSRHRNLEIIVVDDGSNDGSLRRALDAYPDIQGIDLTRNTQRLNVVRNAGIKAARGDYVLLIDNDVCFAPDAIPRLLEVLRADPGNATASPRLISAFDDGERIYWDGGSLHYLGASVCPNRNAPLDTPARAPERNIGCGNVLIDRHKLAEIGYFDEAYALGWADDGEIYYRFLAAGYECLHVSEVTATHIAKLRTTERLGAQLRNRWMFLLKNYEARTLWVVLPALAVFELMQFGFCLLKGAAGIYFKALVQVFKELRGYGADRRRFAACRRRGDGDILSSGDLYIAATHITSPVLRRVLMLAQGFFNGYWRLARRLLNSGQTR